MQTRKKLKINLTDCLVDAVDPLRILFFISTQIVVKVVCPDCIQIMPLFNTEREQMSIQIVPLLNTEPEHIKIQIVPVLSTEPEPVLGVAFAR